MSGATWNRRALLKGMGVAALAPQVVRATTASQPYWAEMAPYLGDPVEQAWLTDTVPLFDCPDTATKEIYYFRWRSYFRSLKRSPDGWVVWEFPYHVTWAGRHNTIVDAAAHHILEGRWLRDPRPMQAYLRFWLTDGDAPLRGFSCWIADAAWGLHRVHPDLSFLADMLQPLVHNYHAWEDVFRRPSGLYTQLAVNDGMEEAASGAQGLRPTLNSYQYGDARAITAIARRLGLDGLAHAYEKRATTLKRLVENRLWNSDTGFFDTIVEPEGRFSGERELAGYIPWYFDLPDARFTSAWSQLTDPQGFQAPFGPTTLERRSKGFTLTETDSLWNGSSWPYATSQTLVALANLLARGDRAPVDRGDYFDLLQTYTRSHYREVDGWREPWIGESIQPLNGHWTSQTRGYNHSSYADLVIGGLVGLRPRDDDVLEVAPMLPPGRWDYFALRDVRYRGHDVSIIWDRDGRRYGGAAGLSILVDGKSAAHRAQLGPLTARLPTSPTKTVPAPQVRDEIGPGRVDTPTITASYWKAQPPSAVLDDADADGLWDYYSSGLDIDWIQVTLPEPLRLTAVDWLGYEDEVRHKAPLSAAIHYWDGQAWTPVSAPVATPKTPGPDRNRISFTPIETDRFRLLMQSRKPGRHGVGGGITRIHWTTA